MEMEGEEKDFFSKQRKLLKKMAGYPMPMLHFLERRLILPAKLCAMLATAGKGATRRQI